MGKSEIIHSIVKIELPYNHASNTIYKKYKEYKNLDYKFSSSLANEFTFEVNSLNVFISSLLGLT